MHVLGSRNPESKSLKTNTLDPKIDTYFEASSLVFLKVTRHNLLKLDPFLSEETTFGGFLLLAKFA